MDCLPRWWPAGLAECWRRVGVGRVAISGAREMAKTHSVVSLGDLEDDVAELKELAQRCSRPTVKAMLTAECERLERELSTRSGMLAGPAQASPSRSNPAPARAPAPAPAPAPAVAAKPKPAPAVSSGPAPVRLPNGAAEDKRVSYSTIASFGWDQDEYGKDPQNVYVHIMSGVDGIGQLKERVSCDFSKRSFDLKIEPEP